MFKRFKKDTKGAVTVFLIIILLPCLIFSGVCYDVGQIEAAKTMVSSAGDLALNAVLSDYCGDLYKLYGLLASEDLNEENVKKAINMYFTNTIESNSTLQATDSVSINILNNLKSFLNDPTQDNFDNVIRMTVSDVVQIKPKDSSKITNPDVMKNQIVEYMKYRGPVSLSSGLLAKFKSIGDVDKQGDTIKAKVAYEEKLDDIGEACNEAFKALNDYNASVQTIIDEDISYTLNAFNNNKDSFNYETNKTQSIVPKIAEILAYHYNSNNKLKLDWNSGIITETEKVQINAKSCEELYEFIRDYVTDNTYLDIDDKNYPLPDKLKLIENDVMLRGAIDGDKHYVTDMDSPKKVFNAVCYINNHLEEITRLYYYCKAYVNKQDTDTSRTRSAKMVKFYNDCFGYDNSVFGYFYKNRTNVTLYKDSANILLSNGKDKARSCDKLLEDCEKKSETAKTKIEKLSNKVKEAEAAKTTFHDSIEALQASDFKASMTADYVASSSNLSLKSISSLKSLLGTYKQRTAEYRTKIKEGGKYVNHSYYDGILADMFGNLSGTSEDNIRKLYIPYDFSKVKHPEKIKDKDSTYKYLKTICREETPENKEESKKEKANLSNLLETTEGSNSIENDAPFASTGDTQTSTSDKKKVKKSFSAKKSASQFSKYITSGAQVLKSLSNVTQIFNNPESSRDALYLSEYMTEMFSYYCIEDIEGKEKLLSLSGNDLTQDVHYKSEAEFLLCGFKTPQENLNAFAVKLFTMRFALNLLYTFTDPEIYSYATNVATIICAAMPFLIPLVTTAVICAFAFGESTLDVELLKAGEDVAFFKTNTTFMFKPANAGKTVAKVLVDHKKQVLDAASKGMDNITNKIKNSANGKIDGVTQDIDAFLGNVIDNISNKAVGIFKKTVIDKAYDLVSDYQDQTVDISASISKALKDVSKVSSGNVYVDELMNYLISNTDLSVIKSKIQTCITELNNGSLTVEGAYQFINKEVDKAFNSIKTKALNKAKSIVNSAGNNLKAMVNESLDSLSEEMKSAALEGVDKAFDQFAENMSTGGADSTSSIGAAGFTMNYKEYLKLFSTLELLNTTGDTSNGRGMLKRVGVLIGENLNQHGCKKDINKMYTMVGITAKVDVNTTFLNTSIFTNNKGEKDISVDLKNKKSFTINYKGMKGY